MEKRTQLAMLLVAIILGVNLMFTARHQKQRQPAGPASGDSMPSGFLPVDIPPQGADLQIPPTPPPASTPFPVAAATDADVVVETPLQRFRISGAGAQVEEITLRKFEIAGDGLVDLVAHRPGASSEARSLGLQLRVPGATWDLSQVRFDPSEPVDGPVVLASGSGPFTLRMRAEASGGGAVVKSFTFDPDRYDFNVDLQIERGGPLANVESYTLQWEAGLPVTEENEASDLQAFRASAQVGQETVRKKLGNFKHGDPTTLAGTIHWTSLQNKYFMVALVPTPPQNGTAELVGNNDQHWMGMRFTNPTPWRSGADRYRVYAGPIAYNELKQLGFGLESHVDLGGRWLRPLSFVLLRFMHALHRVISNYGVIIIILSALAKLVFWPLTEKSFRSMRSMQELQPRMEELKRRFKDEPQEMNRQVMALYKERKVNPVGGCMPLIIQMPIFFALYRVLGSAIELRNAPFVLWIDNLAAPDVLMRFGRSLPVIGDHLSLLPLLMGVAMLWQSKIGASGVPATGPMAQQQFVMKWLMPIMMTFIFYQMPSGLVLYWTVNTLMSIMQQAQINRKFGPSPVVRTMTPDTQGRSAHGAPDRGDGAERGGSSAARPGRVGGKAR